jgi:heat-inducible transcriptional repressor
VVREAGRVLAQLTGAAALVTRPRTDVEPIRELRFMPIRDRTLVAVIVTKSGSVENRIVELAATPSDVELERIHHLLAEVVAGRTLTDARAQLVARMQSERGEYDALKRRAKELLDGVSRSADARDVIIEGQGRLFDRPEFSDPEKIRGFVRAFEDKEQLLELLERTMTSGGVQVLVGSETNLAQVPDVGMISADYRTGGVQAGSVGIIGPTRMDYAKLMPLVAFTADIVGEALDKGGHDDDDE